MLEEDDEFVVDELISSFVCLISGFRNTSFNVYNCWLELPQLTNSSTIRCTFDLFFTPAFLPLDLLLLVILIEEVKDDKLDTLLSLDTTDELIFACLVLWTLPWGENIITLIDPFLLILAILKENHRVF